MKKFLLVATYAFYADCELDINTVNLGNFDSLADCLTEAHQDYQSIAEDYVRDDEGDINPELLNEYLANQTAINPVEEAPENWRVGLAKMILHGWYYDAAFLGAESRAKYTVIKLA